MLPVPPWTSQRRSALGSSGLGAHRAHPATAQLLHAPPWALHLPECPTAGLPHATPVDAPPAAAAAAAAAAADDEDDKEEEGGEEPASTSTSQRRPPPWATQRRTPCRFTATWGIVAEHGSATVLQPSRTSPLEGLDFAGNHVASDCQQR